MSRNFMSMNTELQKGESLLSNNGEYKAVFQDDGNFVVYTWSPIWHSDTANPNVRRLIMQEDCNLVIYTRDNPVWHTNTHKDNAINCRLTLRNDGFLVVENNGNEVWKSTKNN